MKIYFTLDLHGDGYVLVEGEKDDPKYKDESHFLYHLKNALNKEGYDFIKKRMHKDGHLVSEEQQYLRQRKMKEKKQLAIYNHRWAIEGAEDRLREFGRVSLMVTNLYEGD